MKNLKKMSLNLATKELSRKELKEIMAGSGSSSECLGTFYKCAGWGPAKLSSNGLVWTCC